MSENVNPSEKLEADSEPTLSDRKVWTGNYRGVRYEINNFPLKGSTMFKDCWTHYIFLNIDKQLREDVREKFWLPTLWRTMGGEKERKTTEYMESAVAGLDWHGGITFYNKETGLEGREDRWIKAGCDYQHLWDEGHSYSVTSVYREVKQTIDSLWDLYGPIPSRSWWDGKYYFKKEIVAGPVSGEVTQ